MSKACGQSALRDLANDGELSAALRRAFCRILSWRIPPNWSARDWFDEVKAITAAARCQAELDYDFDRGVPLSAFLYQRALTCAWTRYRQEWAYALRFMQEDGTERYDEVATPRTSPPEVCPPDDSLRCALLELPFADQWLVRQLFWNSVAEDKVAWNLKITQQAVNKRKRKIIRKLRHLLRDARAAMLLSGTLSWSAVADPIELPVAWGSASSENLLYSAAWRRCILACKFSAIQVKSLECPQHSRPQRGIPRLLPRVGQLCARRPTPRQHRGTR
jgi:hypothetical protein